jgi:3-hydroxyisobutyrate dehydrogenase
VNNTNSELRTVAVIGLGNMGGPLARHWLEAGLAVRGFDLSPIARAELQTAGGQAFPSAAEAATTADVVVLMLPDSRVVDAVLADLHGAGAVSAGSTILDMGSSEPAESRRQAQVWSERGVGYVDAPVSGGVRGAEAGNLTVMVGGDTDAVRRVEPLLSAVGTPHHVGPVGAGDAVKALNNLLSAAHLLLTSEAVLVAQDLGISAEAALEVFNGSSARSGSTEVKWPKFILPGTFDSGFAARLMLKDVRIATAVARSVGRPSLVGDTVEQVWARAAENLPAGADHTEIARWLNTPATD